MYRRTILAALLALPAGAPALFASAPFEIGADDFQISELAPLGGVWPAVTYSAPHHEYLVAWWGQYLEESAERSEIFVQRLDAATGAERGVDDLRISDAAALGGRASGRPAVAYNPDRDEYLVVFRVLFGDHDHLYAQLLDGATGSEVGIDDLRLTTSVEGQTSEPALVYNPVAQEYLLAWASEGTLGQAPGEYEIYVSRLDGATAAAGAIQPISSMGGLGDPAHKAREPAVAFSPEHDQYLVVWTGRVDQALDHTEVYGQLLDGGGAEIGTDDVQISQTPNPQISQLWSAQPAVAYDPEADRFLVVFATSRMGVGDTPDVYGRTVLPTIGPVSLDFLLSWQPNGIRRVWSPALAFVPGESAFLVAWTGREPLGPAEVEVYGRLVEHDGAWLSPALRLSDVAGSGGGSSRAPAHPALAAAAGHRELLSVWSANDPDYGLGEFEYEIFGQRVGWTLFADGFESGDLSAWPAAAP